MEVQHLFYPRTLKGDRLFDVTEHAAELSKDGPKAKTRTKGRYERNDNFFNNYFVEDIDTS